MRSNPPARMPQAFTYKDAEEVLSRTRRGNLGGNSVIYRDGSDIVVRLYNTDIIRYHPDDGVTLNSGGHRTATTKGRINGMLSPYLHVSQVDGEWFVGNRRFLEDTEFFDGITIYPDGTVVDMSGNYGYRHNPREGDGIHVDIHSHNNPRKEKARHLVGYLARDKEGTELADFNGKGLGWRVDSVVSNWVRPNGDRVKALTLYKGSGRNKSYAGGLWLNDAGTLFRGEVFGKLGGSFMSSSRDASSAALREAEYWDARDAEEENSEEESEI